MGIGLGLLRLSPDAFWRLTLPELAAMAELMFPAERAPSRRTFAELMKRFPDRELEIPLPTRGKGGESNGV